jgi:Zinc-binding dehydrogenase
VRSYAQEFEKLDRLRQQVDAGKITLRVAEVYPPERAADAHRLLEAGGTRGRLVIQFESGKTGGRNSTGGNAAPFDLPCRASHRSSWDDPKSLKAHRRTGDMSVSMGLRGPSQPFCCFDSADQ